MTNELDRYRHISTLGSGGMATVVLAEDKLLGRLVALKRMTARGDLRGLSRLRREALLGASVSHRNLVSVYDVITSEDGDIVIVMEYIEGETLGDAVNRDGRLPAAEALRILDGVAAGLDTIHRQGIVHRDVKPPNILLGADGAVKLADLGIAAVSDHTRITQAGAVLGTFRYMAPEQIEDLPSTSAIDIYALAALAFEVLSGRPARCESNPLALAHAISNQPPPDLSEAWPAAPREAAELLVRGMARDPAMRPTSAPELVGRLRSALMPEDTAPVSPPPGGQTAATAPVSVPPGRQTGAPASRRVAPAGGRRSRRGPIVVGLLSLAAVAVVLAVILSGGGSKPKTTTRAGASHGSKSANAGSGSGSASTSSSTSSSAGTPSGSSAGAPVSAVESFYQLAASHRYNDAWAIADPTFRSQLGGFQQFQSGQRKDRSITFDSARITSQSSTSATVAVKTTSVHTDGTDHCAGTVDLVPGGSPGGWLVHLIHITCNPAA